MSEQRTRPRTGLYSPEAVAKRAATMQARYGVTSVYEPMAGRVRMVVSRWYIDQADGLPTRTASGE